MHWKLKRETNVKTVATGDSSPCSSRTSASTNGMEKNKFTSKKKVYPTDLLIPLATLTGGGTPRQSRSREEKNKAFFFKQEKERNQR